jgi:hypothetical protein
VLPVIVGVLLVAQVAAVATASTTGVRLDQPVDLAAAAGSTTSIPARGEPLVSTDVGPLHVELGVDAAPDERDPQALGCGPNDKPETGVQGDVPLADQLSGRASEGYNCGVDVVGYNPLGNRGGNANLAWAGDCAFVSGEGIAVVNVSDPTAPRFVTTLTTPGSLNTLETLTAGTYGGRSILAAGRYGLFIDFTLTGSAPVDLYDVTDCDHPQHLTTVQFPTGVHNLTLSSDLTRLWSTLPLQAMDISDPTAPRYLGSLEDQLRASGPFHLEYAHEATISADSSRLYIGGQVPGDEGSLILDVSQWPAQPARVVANFGGPGHSLSQATIEGRPYLVRSDESVVPPTGTPCLPSELTPFAGTSHAFLTDLTDETAPVDKGHLTLAIGDPGNCVASLLSGVNPSAHYQNVDDPNDTSFVMVSMWNSGLRIFDVRDPDAPHEVAYFNPGQFPLVPLSGAGGSIDKLFGVMSRTSLDITWGHVRYDARTGTIWMASRNGGFWVLQLQPQVRDRLDLPEVASRAPLPGSPRPAASLDLRPAGALDPITSLTRTAVPAGIYCTLGPVSAL